MKFFRYILLFIVSILFLNSCGVSGDPGHCFISLDWEYYNNDYGVYYYDDTNDDIPELDLIDPGWYYDSYPGDYEYYYESEDERYWYSYTGTYTLIQNLGFQGGLFRDGLNGADTYFDLYLSIYAKKAFISDDLTTAIQEDAHIEKGVSGISPSGREIVAHPVTVDSNSWEEKKGEWIIRFEEEVKVYSK